MISNSSRKKSVDSGGGKHASRRLSSMISSTLTYFAESFHNVSRRLSRTPAERVNPEIFFKIAMKQNFNREETKKFFGTLFLSFFDQ